MIELEEWNYETDFWLHVRDRAYVVIQSDDTGDLSSYRFVDKEAAEEFIKSEERCAYLVSMEYEGGGSYRVNCMPHT